MSDSGIPKTTTSLRSTRSQANPNVTLYSLAETKPLVNSNHIGQTDPAVSGSSKENSGARHAVAESRFFPKRRKIENGHVSVRGTETGNSNQRSRSSSLSSLSPSHLSQDLPDSDTIQVKLESVATPTRRNPRRQPPTPTSSAVSVTPIKVVKEETATPLKTIQTLKRKNESTAKPRPSTPIKLKLEKAHAEPPRWKRQYELIAKMRERIVAPVDTM